MVEGLCSFISFDAVWPLYQETKHQRGVDPQDIEAANCRIILLFDVRTGPGNPASG